MPYYLSEWQGAGTRADPFIPVGSDQPGWTAIDLRSDGGLNACLLHVPLAFTDPRARFLADDKLESLTNPQKNFLTNKLGVDLSSPTLLRDIVATIMTQPPANGWKPIRPGLLQYEIHLGGELMWSAPYISGGATDNFNRANETPIAAPWVAQTSSPGRPNLSSNTVVSAGSDNGAIYSGAASGADQYSELSASTPTSAQGGPKCRMPTTSWSGYMYDNWGSNVNGEIRLWNAGSDSVLVSGSGARANPLRIEAEGSTIRIYANTVLRGTVTNSVLTTGQPGLLIYGGSFDDWSGGDLAAAAVVTPPFYPIIVGSESYQDRSRW